MVRGQVICLETTVSVSELFSFWSSERKREGRHKELGAMAWHGTGWPSSTPISPSLSISTSFFLLSHSRVTQKDTHSTQYATQPEQSWPLKLCGCSPWLHATWQYCHCPPAKMLWQQGTIRGRRRQKQMPPSLRCKMQLEWARWLCHSQNHPREIAIQGQWVYVWPISAPCVMGARLCVRHLEGNDKD